MAGTVVSVLDDEPLMGVTVTVQGDFQAVTDEEGRFFFSDLPTDEVTLRVEFGGYTSLVERVIPTPPEVGVFQIRIAPIWASLSEILVIAGAGPSPAPASADVIVGSNDDSKTALELLAEKIPGVRATLSQGAMRGGFGIRLRGNNSISFSSAPAIYVDGILVNTREGSRASCSRAYPRPGSSRHSDPQGSLCYGPVWRRGSWGDPDRNPHGQTVTKEGDATRNPHL